MTVTHPHLLEKAIRSETTKVGRVLMDLCMEKWGIDECAYRYWDTIRCIRADYKRRVQKKGRRREAA